MYAIVETGGKQYKAEANEILIVEKLEGNEGDTLEIGEVLMVRNETEVQIGSPYIKGARVKVEIVRQCKGPKIEGFNYKPKKNERKSWGHRQPQTHLKVLEVIGS